MPLQRTNHDLMSITPTGDSYPSHQWRLGLAMTKSGDALTMMVNVKTDHNQAKQKTIVGIIVGIVKNNNQERP